MSVRPRDFLASILRAPHPTSQPHIILVAAFLHSCFSPLVLLLFISIIMLNHINNNNNNMKNSSNTNHNVTILVETPRGKTAATSLSPTIAYDSFVQHVWQVARQRDDVVPSPSRKRARIMDEEYKSRNIRRNTFAVYNGKVINPDTYHHVLNQSCKSSLPTISLRLRLIGGMDRQNRVGSKFGGGGVSSTQNAERERKERLKQLALESIELSKDPYLMKNHLGTYECKLCLTLHTNEANYLAHTQGKKHQAGLAKRAHLEKLREREVQQASLQIPVSTLKPARHS